MLQLKNVVEVNRFFKNLVYIRVEKCVMVYILNVEKYYNGHRDKLKQYYLDNREGTKG